MTEKENTHALLHQAQQTIKELNSEIEGLNIELSKWVNPEMDDQLMTAWLKQHRPVVFEDFQRWKDSRGSSS
jgi:hypothetical protein